MMYTPRFLLAGVALSMLVATQPRPARAGPWTPAPRHGYAKLWVKWHVGAEYQDAEGERRDYGAYHEIFWNFYGEVGLVEGLAMWLHAPLVRHFILEDVRSGVLRRHTAPGDPTVGLRWRFMQRGAFVAAVESGLRVPVAAADPVQPVYADEPGTPLVGRLHVGSGVFDVPLRLSAGYGWTQIYVAGAAAYVLRTGDYDHLITWSAEGGWRFAERWTARLRLSGRHPLPTGDAPRTDSPSGVGNGTQYTAFAGELEWNVAGSWSLGLSLEGGALAVRRQSRGPVLSLSVSTLF